MSRSALASLALAVVSLCACASEFSTGSADSPDGSVSGTTGGADNSGGASGAHAGGNRTSGGAAGRNGTGSAGTNTGGASGGASTGGVLGVAGTTGGALGVGGATTGGDTGSGGASTGGTLGTGGASTGGTTTTCQPILNQANLDTGFDNCSDGSKRRRAALQCPEEKTTTTGPCAANPTCKEDADCSQQPNGYCADAHNLAGYCGCYYGCRQDSDCGAGSICECGVVVGHCVSATCKTNADCGAGFGCIGTLKGVAGPTCNVTYPPLPPTYVCQSAADLCRGDNECPLGGGATIAKCLLDGNHLACGLICLPTP